jgi:hypothetical protein
MSATIMTQFKCGNCQEIHNISPNARFCPTCGSSSLNLVVKEQVEPMSKETIGVYTAPVEEEDSKPRPRSKRS